MRAYYKERYGQDSLCVPTCINVTVPAPGVPPRSGNPFVIGYSGNVNSARTGQLRALVRAIGSDAAFAIRYFTPQTPDFLRSQGLWTENSSHLFVTDEGDLVRHLSGCDALFLPLAFDVDQSSRDQLATCFGTKSFEYFLSQRPVIVQCPGDYFTARFFRAGDCGLVVDDPSAEALAAALRRLSSDESLRTRLVQNALEAARQFEGPRVAGLLRSELMRIIGRETRT
jgi:glycosyltransferase involved in cell wall biosynthesis